MSNWEKEALELQQEFCEKLGDRRWDLIKSHERWALETKVGFALFGEPRDAGEVNNNGYSPEQNTEIKKMCNIIYKFAKGPDILIAFLFVIGNSEHGFFISPIFRVQNCHNQKVYFIDNNGRVYDNWRDYEENNKLPKSKVFYPCNGIYDTDSVGRVLVTFTESPASSVTAQVLGVADTGTAIASGVLAVVGVASLFIPVVGPLASAVAWGSAGCGVYGASRGSYFLHDRNTHGQSISLDDAEARNCWLSVLGSALGVGSGLAMKGMVGMVAQGQVVGRAGRIVVDMLNFGALTVNGIGIANNLANLVDKKNNGDLTTLDVLQFTTSVLFFTNAAMNAKTASNVIEQVQKDSISNFSSDLSKRRTKAFGKLVRKSGGDGTMEDRARIIKGITNVGSKDEFFRMTIRAQKQSSSTVLNSKGNLEVKGNAYVDTDIKLQTHVRNNPSVSVASTTFTTQNNVPSTIALNIITSKTIEIICNKIGKKFIRLFNGTILDMKDLFDYFADLFKKYFSSKGNNTFPSEKISDLIIHCENFVQEERCGTREEFIDFARFLFIYERSRLKEMEKSYQKEKNDLRERLGEEFDESSFNLKWGFKNANDRESSFLTIINDEIKDSNNELKEKFEIYNAEITAYNEDGGLKFQSNYNALNEFYHSFVIDGQELSPSDFFGVIRGLADDDDYKLTVIEDSNHGNCRFITYYDEENAVMIKVEKNQEGRFLKSVSFGNDRQI